MSAPAVAHVSDTAFWVAHFRAVESERPDALFRDPLAKVLDGGRGEAIAKRVGGSNYIAWSVALRTRIIDDYVRASVAAGADTVLNLGAGLDTRPYRLDLPPGLRWIEADHAEMIAFKEQKLAAEKPRCQLERRAVDLSNADARRALLADVAASSKEVFVLTEGVVLYLDKADVAALADDLRAQPAFRSWVLEYMSPALNRFRDTKKRREAMRNAPTKFAVADFFGFFEEHGWKQREVHYLGDLSEQLGRPMPAPWWARFLRILTPRDKQAQLRKLMGYVLLEPKV